jgi:BirA family biotin operon repressor/biotin-[acetyl-CoA-carboxylase] ligase
LEGEEPWREIRVVEQATSTNTVVSQAAAGGAAAGLVVIAEEQTSGRGRLDRIWQAPPRSAVLLSVLLRPVVPTSTLPMLSLLAGVAAVEAVRSVAELPAVLKWPNDVLVGGRKLGGILVDRVDAAAVVGVGINVSLRPSELPVDTATSIAIEGGNTDRESLTKELLRALGRRARSWETAEGAAASLLPAYREVCDTLGREVVIHLPDGTSVTGLADSIDETGRLVLLTPDGQRRAWSVGDVVHVRVER